MAEIERAEREDALRCMLDGGRCILVGDKWFGPGSTEGERRRYLLEFNRQRERNRKRRNRRMALRVLETFERRLSELPARVQTRLTGRTATVEMIDGVRHRVDYAKIYSPRRDPFSYPFPDGKTPLELVADGGMAAWTFIARARSLLNHTLRRQRGAHGASRLRDERRKLCVRSTLAPCPTATDVRVAWAFARETHKGMARLGGLLHDLECHLGNGLLVKRMGRQPKIVGREAGIRGWIRGNCPELIGKYKTLMRYKALAKRLRQAAEMADPVPTSAILGEGVPAEELLRHEVSVQPRASGGRIFRFAWERGEWRVDADGRSFRTNENYRNSSRTVSLVLAASRGRSIVEADAVDADTAKRLSTLLESARSIVREILAAAKRDDMEHGALVPTIQSLWGRVEHALAERERWWEGHPI